MKNVDNFFFIFMAFQKKKVKEEQNHATVQDQDFRGLEEVEEPTTEVLEVIRTWKAAEDVAKKGEVEDQLTTDRGGPVEEGVISSSFPFPKKVFETIFSCLAPHPCLGMNLWESVAFLLWT